jgi:hypothetical protein
MMMNADDHPHLDVLQNIEFSVIQIYTANPELTDYQVDTAYQALYQNYRGEHSGRKEKTPSNPLSAEVYHAVRAVCEWRLGRDHFVDQEGRQVEIASNDMEIEEIMSCLKELRKSVRLWTKQGGRQGYFNYIDKFF